MTPATIGLATAALAAGAGVTSYAAVNARSQIFGATVRTTNSPRRLALTFDDGPNPAITPRLLDLLDHHQARATFFVIGKFVRQCPDLVKEVAARGHIIGNHTETHPNLFWSSAKSIRDELQQCQGVLQDVLGAPVKWFRPPYGYRNPWVVSAAAKLGMRTVMWTLLPGDWHEKPAEWLLARLKPIAAHAQNATNGGTGDILCLHDGAHRQLNGDRARTLAALEHCLPRWRGLGLEFVTISEAVS